VHFPLCYKISLCENSQHESCKAFTGPSIRTKLVVGGGRPLKGKFFLRWTTH